MMKRILLEIIITESKREFMKYAAANKISSETVEQVMSADPSPTKKYTFTVLRWIVPCVRNQEEIAKAWRNSNKNYEYMFNTPEAYARDTVIREFSRYISKFYRFNGIRFKKDFQSFKTVDEFAQFMVEYSNELSGKQKRKVAKDPTAVSKVFENDKCIILHIKKKEASCLYGKGTKWCITGLDVTHFENYSVTATIYFIIDKKNPTIKYAVVSNNIKPAQSLHGEGNGDYATMDVLKNGSAPVVKLPLDIDVYNAEDYLLWSNSAMNLVEFWEGQEIFDSFREEYEEYYTKSNEDDDSQWSGSYREYLHCLITFLRDTKNIIPSFDEISKKYDIPDGEKFFKRIPLEDTYIAPESIPDNPADNNDEPDNVQEYLFPEPEPDSIEAHNV